MKYANTSFFITMLMNQVLLPIFYMPPISWFSVFLNDENKIFLEQFENFPKQTYRNRANIYGANGKLSLIIPIKHNGNRIMNQIESSDAENWKNLHWKSIKTAYQSSPYFEFYEDQLQQIFNGTESKLIDISLKSIEIFQKILKTKKAHSLTEEYVKNPKQIDLRSKFSAKEDSQTNLEVYYQTFSDKLGFVNDLSILDLVCNQGPESYHYIKNQKIILK